MGVLTDIAGKIPSSLQCEGKNVSKQRIKSFRTRERRYMALTWNCLEILTYLISSHRPFSVTRPYFHSAKNIILVL